MFKKLNLRFLKNKFDKEKDVSKEQTAEFDLPLINAKDGNNGIMYYGRSSDFESTEMTIDIVNDGAVSTGNVYPQPQKTGVLYNAYLVKPLFSVTQRLLYFFSTTIQKSIKLKFGYENKAGWEKVKKEKISLPTHNGAIDFAFMETFIAELEAYLTVTGLKDYTLTEEEEETLNSLDKVQWRDFTIGDLFEIATGRDVIIRDVQQGNIPLISHQHENNGITKYIKPLKDRTLFNHQTTISLADRGVFYATNQNEDFHIGTRVKALSFKQGKISKKVRLFLVSAINKLQVLFTEYSQNATDKLPFLKITLPTKNGTPDYDFMNTYISAIHKVVIKEVVLYAEKKMQATQEAIK